MHRYTKYDSFLAKHQPRALSCVTRQPCRAGSSSFLSRPHFASLCQLHNGFVRGFPGCQPYRCGHHGSGRNRAVLPDNLPISHCWVLCHCLWPCYRASRVPNSSPGLSLRLFSFLLPWSRYLLRLRRLHPAL